MDCTSHVADDPRVKLCTVEVRRQPGVASTVTGAVGTAAP
jgi:hypothetical protein